MKDMLGALPRTDEPSRTVLPLRVLVTAQAFGFGPAASMAQVFHYLRPRVHYLGFVGAGHTCDIHMQLPYDAVHRLPAERYGEAFRRLCADYDAVLNACDFVAAEAAKDAGIPFAVYDPIPWFWPQWPSIFDAADLCMCQDFFGVRERIRDFRRENVVIVPPILPSLPRAAAKRGSHILVNLGGLANPMYSHEVSVAYARLATAIVPAATQAYLAADVHVVTSQSIVAEIQREVPAARTLSPSEVQDLLGSSELAAMTPGLGNIYEAAVLAERVFWLPPANTSQGQQIAMLKQRGLAPFAADWHDILPSRPPIDYGEPELISMERIADAIHAASADPGATERLQALFLQARRAPKAANPLASLARQFGDGGAQRVAEIFIERVLALLAITAGQRRPALAVQ